MSWTSHAFTVKTWCTWSTEHIVVSLIGLFNQIHSYVYFVVCKVLLLSG